MTFELTEQECREAARACQEHADNQREWLRALGDDVKLRAEVAEYEHLAGIFAHLP
jgi:hypothetical protein